MSEFITNNTFYPEALAIGVPNMDDARRIKQGYNEVPIDTANEMFHEPITILSDLNIAGEPYYSKPNAATGDQVPGVGGQQYLRASVAQTLKDINDKLKQPELIQFFEGEVELYIEEALRPLSLQEKLYDQVFPDIIRKQHQGITDEELFKRRSELIAVPSRDPLRPSPHATGGVFDVSLRYIHDNSDHKTGDKVEMGHTDGDTTERVNPDYYELHKPQNELEALACRNRRAFYAIMTGRVFGIDTGFQNNPTEWWHWGRGDQLSARLAGQEAAIYSLAPEQSS